MAFVVLTEDDFTSMKDTLKFYSAPENWAFGSARDLLHSAAGNDLGARARVTLAAVSQYRKSEPLPKPEEARVG